jgi:hypothetical protein
VLSPARLQTTLGDSDVSEVRFETALADSDALADSEALARRVANCMFHLGALFHYHIDPSTFEVEINI